jgi:lambda repressor-like predicted transcriptional regulator
MLDESWKLFKPVIAGSRGRPPRSPGTFRPPARGRAAPSCRRQGVSGRAGPAAGVIVWSMTDPGDGPAPDPSALRARYEAGESVRAISRAVGIPAKTAHRRLREAGTRFRRPGGQAAAPAQRPPLTDDDRAAIKAAYLKGGVSLDDLGARYQRSGDTIGRILRSAGIEIRPRGRTIAAGPAPQTRPGVAAMHRQGMRPADIAARIPGATAASIGRELRHGGLTPHRGRAIPAGADLAAAYAEAGSVRALAARLHADEARIRGALAEIGVPAGSLRRIPVPLRPDAARLAVAGTAPDRIAQITGLPAAATAFLGKAAPSAAASARAA